MDLKILSSILLVIFVTINLPIIRAESSHENKNVNASAIQTINCTYIADYNDPTKLTCKVFFLELEIKAHNICISYINVINGTRNCTFERFVNFNGTEEEKKNTYTVWFQNSNITTVPAMIYKHFPKLEEIIINSYKGNTLKRSLFQNLVSLKRLDLSNYNTIEAGAFHTLPNVEVLDLSINEIDELPQNVFQMNTKLKKLMLSRNKLNDADFLVYLRDLEVIDLSENKDINIAADEFQSNRKLKEIRLTGIVMEKIEEKLFENLVDLEVVDLSSNLLSEIPTNLFKDNIKLKEIYLNGNQISKLDKNIFKNLQNLEKVKFNSNSLKELSPEVFESNKKLSYLDVRFNNFTEVDELSFQSAIPNLTKFYFSGADNNFKGISLTVVLCIALSSFLL